MLCKLSLEEPYILNRVISVTVFLWSGTIAGFFILNEYTIHSIEVLAMVHSLIWFLGLLGIVFGLNHIGQSKRKLLEGKDRLEIMFKSMHNGLLLIHAHTHIIKDANPAACRLINAPREEIVGQLCHQFICPAEIGACPITDLFQTMENSESVLIAKDGSQVNVLKTVVPVIIDSQPYLLESFVDVSVQTRMAEEMRKLLARLEKQNQQLHLKTRELQDNEKKFRSIFNSFQDLYFRCDIDGIIEIISPSVKSLSGYDGDELIGKSVLDIFIDKADQKKLMTSLLANGKVNNYELSVKKKNQDIVTVRLYGRIIDDDTNSPVAIEGVMRDVSEWKKNQIALKKRVEELDQTRYAMLNMIEDMEEARNEAERGAKAKGIFLANMSHEIRTPMNAILGFLELSLEDNALPEHIRKHLDIAQTSASALLVLINDILDVSKLESGKFTMEHCRFSLVKLIREVHEVMDIKAREKGIKLKSDIHQSLPEIFVGDPLRLRQIILNLLGNAIKFTPKGRVAIQVLPGEKQDQLHFIVADTGIGISSDHLDHIFKAFSQADTSTTRKFGGSGLGTSISRELVELMEGKIWAESEEGRGSKFHFIITLLSGDELATECDQVMAPEKPAPLASRSGFKILLVEDIEANIDLARIRLEQQGHKIIVARNGREAIEAVAQKKIDIVLMDIQMPEMDGIEATKHIRAMKSDNGQFIPIIAMTASVMEENTKEFIEVGMNAIVAKPINFIKLFKEMEALVPKGVGEMAAKRSGKVSILGAELPSLEGIDIPKGLKTWQNPKAYTKALVKFAQDYVNIAGDLTGAIGKDNMDKAYHIIHALKGVAGNLAIIQVADAATSIEAVFGKKQSGDVKEKISKLDAAIDRAINSINQLEQVPRVEKMPKKKKDPAHLKELFNNMLPAFDQFSPNAVEPFLSELEAYLSREQLDAIVKYIELFEFESAKQETIKLGKTLGIYHGKYKQNR